jgi:hypothetical protein
VYELVMNTPMHVPLTKFKIGVMTDILRWTDIIMTTLTIRGGILGNIRNKNTDHNLTGNVQFNFKTTKLVEICLTG